MSSSLRVFSSVAFLLLSLFCGNDAFAQSASFTMSASSGCSSGFTANFTGAPSGASAYYWNLGNGNTSTSQNPSTTYNGVAGWRYITLTVTTSSGTATATDSVYVYNGPGIAFSATKTSSCVPLSTTFNATATPNASGALSYDWDFGDGNTSSGTSSSGLIPSITHNYTVAGTYSVTLHATNSAGCDSSFTRIAYITVYPNPTASFSAAPNLYCSVPATATFINNTTGGATPYSLSWNYGDGNTGSSLTHTYTSSGSFNVTLTVTDANGCQGTLTSPGLITTVGTQATLSAPTSACLNAIVAVTNTTGTSVASWNFGDGDSTGFIPKTTVNHPYYTAGTYTIAVTTNINGCIKTATQTIVIHPLPAVTITQSPSVPCHQPSTVTFVASATPASTYLWNFGGSQTANTQTVSYTYAANGVYSVSLTATSAAGCVTTMLYDTVYIRDIAVIIAPGSTQLPGPAPRCVTDSMHFNATLFTHVPPPMPPPLFMAPYPFGIATWQWDFGDGSPGSTAALPVHKYQSIGTYTIRCIITSSVNGCIDTGYARVKLDSPVTPSFIATPTVACVHELVTFINTTPYHSNTGYAWDLGDTTIFKQDTGRVIRSFKRSGPYTIELVSFHFGCTDTVIKLSYVTVNPPTAGFIDSIFCSPRTKVKFINASLQSTSQLWDFGDGSTDTAFSPIHNYAATGNYNVKLKTFNSSSGCSDTMVRTVKIVASTASFTINRTTLCPGQTAVATGTWTGIGTPYFSFLFGSFETAPDTTSATNFFRFGTRGYYDVSFIIASGPNQSCHDTVYKHNLVVVSQPIVSFAANPSIGCQPFTTSFTDSSTNTPGIPNITRLWQWNYVQIPADSTRTGLTTISHTYPFRGTYDVRLTVTDSLGCTDTLTRFGYIQVRRPTAKFSVSKDTACAHESLRFSDSSSGATMPLTHYWAFGDGATSTADSPLHSYAAPGTYFVRLIVTDSTGCTDTASRSKPIVIRAPHAAFTPGKRLGICPPLLISFTNNSTGAATYLWDFNNGSPLTPVFSPSTTYRNPGVYVPVLIATDPFGCSDTARDTIRVLGYNGAFTYSPLLGCIPLPVSFYAPFGTGVPSLTWDFADGTTLNLSASTTASHTYTTPGAYIPRVIFSDGTSACTSTSVGLDTIKVDKLVAHLTWDPVCVFSPFKLYDSSYAVFNPVPVSAVRWGFGPGDSATGTPVTHTYNTPGNHPVTIIVSNASGCTATETRDVFVNYLPIVSAGPDSTGVCPDDSAKLVATGALTYVWSPAADLSPCRAAACDTAYGHRVPGWYYVMGTDGNGCVNKDSIKAFIQIKTMSSVGAGGEICVGDTFRLSDSGATSYTWSPAQFLDSPNIASPLSKPPTTITFIVAAQKSTCLVDSQRVTVVVHPLPFFDAGPDEELRLGSAVILEATGSGFRSIAWTRDSTLSCLDCLRPTAFPHYTTIYRATFTDIYGCESTDSVTVRVHCNGSLTFIPNTFTPNGDGQNDVFYPRAQGIRRIITFRIFNRWGQMVFERMNVVPNDASMGWDGTFNGQALPPDTYFYMMDTHCETGEPVSWKGDITLVR